MSWTDMNEIKHSVVRVFAVDTDVFKTSSGRLKKSQDV